MSYILDALRRSDLQRQRGSAPTLLAVQEPPPERKRPGFLGYGLLAAVLLGAGILIGWLRPWQSEPPAALMPEPVSRPIESKPLPSPPPSTAAHMPAPFQIAPQSKPEPNLEDAKPRKPKRLPKLDLSKATEPPAREGDALAPKTAPPVDTPAVDVAAEKTVISMAELPSPVRAELPAITISVHAYSGEPSGRLLGVGSRILREGDFLAPGLQLVEITPEGMILDYKGYRFHRGVK